MKTVFALISGCRLRAPSLFLLTLLAASGARAELVPVQQVPGFRETQFVQDTALNATEFEITKPGQYRVTLIDYAFPEAFEELSLAITDAAATFFMQQLQRGEDQVATLEIPIDVAGTYVASVFASLGAESRFGYGRYSVEVQLVPVPAAGWLLASGLVMVGAWRRRSR